MKDLSPLSPLSLLSLSPLSFYPGSAFWESYWVRRNLLEDINKVALEGQIYYGYVVYRVGGPKVSDPSLGMQSVCYCNYTVGFGFSR